MAERRTPKKRTYATAPPARTRTEFTNDPLLKELHETFDYATDAWTPIRDAGAIDMRFISGDTWDPNDRAIREESMRPCASFDELGQFVNQIINNTRQNKRAVKVTPLGNGATDHTAALRAAVWRQTEYENNAQQAYTVMFENAVQRSYGYVRLGKKYASPSSRHMSISIEPLVNPDLTTPDPDALRPDLSDMKYLFQQESWLKSQFKKQFPKAKAIDFSTELLAQAPRWLSMERVMVAEWWQVRMVEKTLLFIDVPATPAGPNGPAQAARQFDVFEEDLKAQGALAQLPEGARVVGQRRSEVPSVTKRITNGLEILDEEDWDGRYIPFVGCFGKIIYVNEGSGPEKRILSAHRLAQSAAQLYSFCRTGQQEQIGMMIKAAYFVRKGSLSPEEADKLAKSIHEPVSHIEVNAMADNIPAGMMPEFPVRNMLEPNVQALELLAEGARRAIQAGMAISPLPTSAQRRNEKSGVALKQIEESGQKGTFHFDDNLNAAITRVAVIGDDLINHVHDVPRTITVRRADDTPIQIRVNDPDAAENKDAAEFAEPGSYPNLTTGEHDYTLSTGPSFDSQREMANAFVDGMTQNIDRIAAIVGPQAAAKILALGVRQQDIGAFGDEIAEIMSPPEQEGGLSPEMQQAKQMVDQLQARVKELESGLAVEQLRQQGNLEVEKMRQQTAMAIAASKGEVDLRKTGINADVEIRGQDLSAINALTDREHEQRMAHIDRADAHATDHVARIHEHQRDTREHAQALQMAEHQAQQADIDRETSAEQAELDRQAASESSSI